MNFDREFFGTHGAAIVDDSVLRCLRSSYS